MRLTHFWCTVWTILLQENIFPLGLIWQMVALISFRYNSQHISKFFYMLNSQMHYCYIEQAVKYCRVEGHQNLLTDTDFRNLNDSILILIIQTTIISGNHIHPMITSVRHPDFHQDRPLTCFN